MVTENTRGSRKREAEEELESGRVFDSSVRLLSMEPPTAVFPDVPGGISMREPPEWTVSNAKATGSPWRTAEYSPLTTMYAVNNRMGKYLSALVIKEGHETLARRLIKAATTLSAQVQRFLDPKQTAFEGTPLPDGSNLFTATNGSQDLANTFHLYKKWLTALHMDSLIRVETAEDGTKSLNTELMELFKGDDPWHARTLWENEADHASTRTFERGDRLDILPHRTSISTPRHPFWWVRRWRQWLVDAADEVHAIATWRWVQMKSAKEAEEAVEHVYAQLPPAAVILMSLVEAENKFENALSMNHVEDVVIDKRLVLFSEKEATKLRDFDQVITQLIAHEGGLQATLAPTSHNFRKSFNYRLLRDWGYGRAWTKLFLMLPADMREVSNQINESFDPKHGKLCYDLFDVHPKIREEMGMDDSCHACLGDYEDGEMMMLLHCKHHMHPACAFSSWDEPHRFNFLCPVCRFDPLTFREKVKFYAERSDEDWMKEDGGHARHDHVMREMHTAQAVQVPQDWPQETWRADTYLAYMINCLDLQREVWGMYRTKPLPGGGGIETDAMRRQAALEARAAEAERREREGVTRADAAAQSRDLLRQRLLEQNPQYAAEREEAIRRQEEENNEFEVVEGRDGPVLQRVQADGQGRRPAQETQQRNAANRSPPQDRQQTNVRAKTPQREEIAMGLAQRREQALQRRARTQRRMGVVRMQAAERRDAERAERVAAGLRATPDPETDDQGTGGMDVGTGYIFDDVEPFDEEEEDDDDDGVRLEWP